MDAKKGEIEKKWHFAKKDYWLTLYPNKTPKSLNLENDFCHSIFYYS